MPEPSADTITTQVRHVRAALLENYSGLIFDEDLRGYDPRGREQRFLSRALAAEAIRIATGCDYEAAAASVIDGERDQGIDAIAVGDSGPEVVLVQAKWSDVGNARLDRATAQALAEGLRAIDSRQFERFNDRLTPLRPQLDAAMGDARLHITLVLAVMGPASLGEGAKDVIDTLVNEANHNGPLLRREVLGAADFHRRLRRDLAPDPVDVSVTMRDWLRKTEPFDAWQGTVAIREVARWYDEHRDDLYEQNVRKSLGITRINTGIKETLLKEPDNFWYFNNGITVLCTEIEPHFLGRRKGDEPVELRLTGVSVVNGAQTVTAIHEAMRQNSDVAEDADVTVRVFSLGDDRERYAARITETTNTQNDVSRRDFIALDPVQAEIREDFLLSGLGKYTYKRGEAEPGSDSGCSVEQAAVALACAHRTPELAVRANQDVETLWERGARGAYTRLFKEGPSAHRIWRAVQVRREVGKALEIERKELHGRAAEIARRGELLVVHLVFQCLDQDEMDDPAANWDAALARVPELTARNSAWLVHHLDATFGEKSLLGSTFNDETRCRTLARAVLADVERGAVIPVLPADYRPPARGTRTSRRPNTVPTLVNSGRIPDGTLLRYVSQGDAETEAVQPWLDEDPRRATATWVNDRVRCLLWGYDEQVYSASGLVQRIWELAEYESAPVSVQGPRRWLLSDGASLWDRALQIYAEEEEAG